MPSTTVRLVSSTSRALPLSSSSSRVRDKNYVAAFFHMLTVALLCTSLAQPSWFLLTSRSGTDPMNFCPKHLTLNEFFDFGYFETRQPVTNETKTQANVKMLYHSAFGTLDCLSPSIVNTLKIILMLDLVAAILSFFAFLMDVIGTKNGILFCIRSNGLLSIITILICAVIVGMSYYSTVLIEKENRQELIEVTYDLGFYTLAASGLTSLLATASSLFRRNLPLPRPRSRSRRRARSSRSRSRESRLMLVESTESPSLSLNYEAPPPYAP